MKKYRVYKKEDFPVSEVRRYLEPGPVVLVSSQWKGERDIMTMGWHTVMEFSPSLVGCMITEANHSFALIEKSGECVLNLPVAAMADAVVGIGNTSGAEVDKFGKFGLTAGAASLVQAPLIRECYACFECRVYDRRLLSRYNFFILEVVKAHVATYPPYPRTLHYRGGGVFMLSGRHIAMPERFRPENR